MSSFPKRILPRKVNPLPPAIRPFSFHSANQFDQLALLEEKPDPKDGRARLLRLTAKGTSTLKKAQHQAEDIANLLFRTNADAASSPTLKTLEQIDQKFGRILMEEKPKTWAPLRAQFL